MQYPALIRVPIAILNIVHFLWCVILFGLLLTSFIDSVFEAVDVRGVLVAFLILSISVSLFLSGIRIDIRLRFSFDRVLRNQILCLILGSFIFHFGLMMSSFNREGVSGLIFPGEARIYLTFVMLILNLYTIWIYFRFGDRNI